MGFAVSPDAYDRFMGRYSVPLAPVFADFVGVESGQRAVDVGCGPGSLTAELVKRLGDLSVVGVDPSEPFVEAVRERHPRVEVHRASAERLPLPNDTFDAAMAQLVVHFMTDPVAGLRDMSRVVKPGGIVAACVWDFDEGGSPLSLFWAAATVSTPRQLARAPFREHAAVTSHGCSGTQVSRPSSTRNSRSRSSTRASRTGGNPSSSASAPQALMFRRWLSPSGDAWRSAAANSSRRHRLS